MVPWFSLYDRRRRHPSTLLFLPPYSAWCHKKIDDDDEKVSHTISQHVDSLLLVLLLMSESYDQNSRFRFSLSPYIFFLSFSKIPKWSQKHTEKLFFLNKKTRHRKKLNNGSQIFVSSLGLLLCKKKRGRRRKKRFFFGRHNTQEQEMKQLKKMMKISKRLDRAQELNWVALE